MISAPAFSHAFRDQMESLGLPVPPQLFENFDSGISNVSLMAAILPRLDDRAPLSQLIRMTLGLEKLMVAGQLNAVDYTGAAIGSIGVASGELSGDGVRMSELFRFTYRHQLQFPHWDRFFLRNPQVLDPLMPHRHSFGSRAQLATRAAAS